MVTLAIVGLLVLVALPRFRSYMSRSRQVEAKLSLGISLTAERSFYSENNTFTGCLGGIGVSAPRQPFHFSFGFEMWATLPGTLTLAAGAVSCSSTPTAQVHYFGANKMGPAGAIIVGVLSGYGANVANATNLMLGADGIIGFNLAVDFWTISNDGELLNVKSGI